MLRQITGFLKSKRGTSTFTAARTSCWIRVQRAQTFISVPEEVDLKLPLIVYAVSSDRSG
jgi:hypothetical protein